MNLAVYANMDQGNLVVCESNLNQSKSPVLQTGIVDAENLIWCGNDAIILFYSDTVIMVGPGNQNLAIDLGNPRQPGIICKREPDGLRIINSEGTFFLERVKGQVIETFKKDTDIPAAKLL